ncbi:DUF1905 domain-containing protein [Marinomonas piezotolerans]|uniref:DUF1905 domain-containing protein n=1 Tax=Marinomonas piezotolerans TaxID=2213058 RepID=A0A370UBY0_9GAMM|nr:DUF1905 domain-containing protein [Marinomonas piezotolerans]
MWRSFGPSGWYFLTLPSTIAHEIRLFNKGNESGWGRLRVTAKINANRWETSIWFDSKANSYLLPINAKVRKSESLTEGSLIEAKVITKY